LQTVDIYDALRTARPYKPALGHEDSTRVMQNEAAGRLDPKLVERFLEMLRKRQAA
jgi:putative two-component system response regulator